jgi:hypothetical protein
MMTAPGTSATGGNSSAAKKDDGCPFEQDFKRATQHVVLL